MGRKRNKKGKISLYLVAKRRSFPHFPLSFQHLTSVLHIGCGKKHRSPPFNISFTSLPQPGGKPKPHFPTRLFRVFHKFPTPYYGYYNKFNILLPSGSSPKGRDPAGSVKKGEILF
jgi:hypothetical protein